MDWLRRNPLLGLLAVVALVLAGVLAAEIHWAGRSSAAQPARRVAAAEAKLLPPMVVTAPEQAYPETAARPIFTPTRRPAPEAVVAQQPTFQRNQFVLLGVTIAGPTRIAMLRERASGRLHRIEQGGSINNIKVAEVKPDSVTLALGPEQEQVQLLVSKAGGAPGVQPAAPSSPVTSFSQGPFGAGNVPPPSGAPPLLPGQPPQGGGTPFAGVPPTPVPGQQPGAPNPIATPGQVQQQAPMTPEELLERRRARRAQQTQ